MHTEIFNLVQRDCLILRWTTICWLVACNNIKIKRNNKMDNTHLLDTFEMRPNQPYQQTLFVLDQSTTQTNTKQ
jgi:hypothetical protein